MCPWSGSESAPMQSRRSFFSRLGALVAVVAMAPEIAFSAKLGVQPTLNATNAGKTNALGQSESIGVRCVQPLS